MVTLYAYYTHVLEKIIPLKLGKGALGWSIPIPTEILILIFLIFIQITLHYSRAIT
jgi:hypothetical protein